MNGTERNDDPEKPQGAEGEATEVMICVKLVNIVNTQHAGWLSFSEWLWWHAGNNNQGMIDEVVTIWAYRRLV